MKVKESAAESLKTLLFYYRKPNKMKELWLDEKAFSKTLLIALNVEKHDGVTRNLDLCADYFIDFTSVFLIKHKTDILKCLCEIKKTPLRTKFMNRFLSNDLVLIKIVFDLLEDEALIEKIGDYNDWISYPLRLRAGKVIESAVDGSVEVADIVPVNLDLCNFTKEYLLSWAYEERKLSEEGEIYFKTSFAKKYDMLSSIMGK